MRMTVLASGSKGNSTVIASAHTRILVDAGLSCRELLKRMALANEDPAALDAILITHEHQDHVAGLATLARRLRIPVFLTEPTHRAWVRMVTPRTTMTYAQWLDRVQKEKEARTAAQVAEAGAPSQTASPSEVGSCPTEFQPADPDPDSDDLIEADTTAKPDPASLPAVEYFHSGTHFSIGDISITPFTIPHDAADPCGFVFESARIRPHGHRHRPRLHAAQRQVRPQAHRCPAARIQPRPRDAQGRPLPLGGQAACPLPRRPSLQPRHRRVPRPRLRWRRGLHRPRPSLRGRTTLPSSPSSPPNRPSAAACRCSATASCSPSSPPRSPPSAFSISGRQSPGPGNPPDTHCRPIWQSQLPLHLFPVSCCQI